MAVKKILMASYEGISKKDMVIFVTWLNNNMPKKFKEWAVLFSELQKDG